MPSMSTTKRFPLLLEDVWCPVCPCRKRKGFLLCTSCDEKHTIGDIEDAVIVAAVEKREYALETAT